MKFVRSTLVLALVGALFAMTAIASAQPRNFTTHLSGGNEVPPVETRAQGQVKLQLSKDATELRFKLIVANIDGVAAAHIHCATEGQNGPVGVTLFAGGPQSTNGPLAQGTITEPDAGNGCDWSSLQDIVSAIEDGGAYVNVHTLANPGGEIRGQLR